MTSKLLLLLIAARTAQADPPEPWHSGPTYLTPGLFLDVGKSSGDSGKTSNVGGGLELTIHHFYYQRHASGPNSLPLPRYWVGPGVGAFLKLEDVSAMPRDSSTSSSHLQVSAGGQFTWFLFGLELGAVYDGSDATHPNDFGFRVAPFVTFGFIAIAVAGTFPAVHAGSSYGETLSLLVSLKLPLHVSGHGRFAYFSDE